MPHIHEKIDYCVEVFIVHKDKVLLRFHEKHNLWLSVGGHIELDENPLQAAVREVKEEVGLDIKIVGSKPAIENEFDYEHLIAPRYLATHHVNDTHQHVVLIYFATSQSNIISGSKNEHERAETRWVTKEELKTMNLRPNILFYATEVLNELGEK
ncbi:MAG: NUDIX domain-containing protein [Candidatus Paceibacterota bacterium]